MRRSMISRSMFTPWLVGLGVVLAQAGCSSSSGGTPTATGPDNASSGSGGSSGSAASSGTSSGGGGGSGSGTPSSSGAGSSGPGSSGAGTATSGSTGSTSGAVAGPGGSGSSSGTVTPEGGTVATDASVGGNCMAGDTTPCSSFTGATGQTLQLGPYGAQMDVNVGTGFKNAVNADDMPANASVCQNFVNSFGEDPKLGAKLLQTTNNGVTLDFSLYSVYRPAVWPEGQIPVITWGNGTCAQPEGYSALLRYVASFGYFVVAANSRWVGTGTPAPMINAINFAAAAAMDSTSPYYGKLDMTKVGAMGHSQGGSATATAASDSRVKDVIIFNAVDSGVVKPYLTLSGDSDITGFTAASMSSAVNASTQPAAYLYEHNPAGMGSLKGHLVLMLTPERVTGPTVGWWQMMFRNDSASHAMFVGSGCGLCAKSTDYDYGANTLLK